MSNRPHPKFRFDFNKNGNLSQEEIRDAKELVALELAEEKAETQRKFGWVSMVSIIGFTGLLFSPVVSVERVTALSGAIDMFYISMAGVIGAVVGVTAWISKSRLDTYSGYSGEYEEVEHSTRFGKYGSTF